MNILPTDSFDIVAPILEEVRINQLFAKAVIKRTVDGAVYVDRLENPKAIYVKHPYGMSLVCGDNQAFEKWESFWDYLVNYSQNEVRDEWLQAWPNPIAEAIDTKLNRNHSGTDKTVERHTRMNFKFDELLFAKNNRKTGDAETFLMVRTSKKEYDKLQGSVIPGFFWRDRENFLKHGVGFSLIANGRVASTAFSAFIDGRKLELGIETHQDFRGKGYAQVTCRRLVKYCLENSYEPIWSCRKGNIGSVRLAERLGFKVAKEIPYYRLMGSPSMDEEQKNSSST